MKPPDNLNFTRLGLYVKNTIAGIVPDTFEWDMNTGINPMPESDAVVTFQPFDGSDAERSILSSVNYMTNGVISTVSWSYGWHLYGSGYSQIYANITATSATVSTIKPAEYSSDFSKLTWTETFNLTGYGNHPVTTTMEKVDTNTGLEQIDEQPRVLTLTARLHELLTDGSWDYTTTKVLSINLESTTSKNQIYSNNTTVYDAGEEIKISVPATLTLYPAIWSKEFQPPIAL